MKVKKTILFEQGAYLEARYDENTYKFTNNEILYYSFEPQYHDDYVYVCLIDYGGEYTILVKKIKVDKEFVVDSAKVMPAKSENYDNVRLAIAEFDSLLKNHPMTWVTGAEVVEEKSSESVDDLPF